MTWLEPGGPRSPARRFAQYCSPSCLGRISATCTWPGGIGNAVSDDADAPHPARTETRNPAKHPPLVQDPGRAFGRCGRCWISAYNRSLSWSDESRASRPSAT
jgi:hypothetical protein